MASFFPPTIISLPLVIEVIQKQFCPLVYSANSRTNANTFGIDFILEILFMRRKAYFRDQFGVFLLNPILPEVLLFS